MEEKVDRVYTASNAVQKTSDYIVQDNEQQLYKFTTEFNPNDRLQTEYNLLIKSASDIENTDLTSSSNRGGVSNLETEKIDILKSQKPSSINQELKAQFLLYISCANLELNKMHCYL